MYTMCHLDDILKKSPEVNDVYDLIKEHSANWNDLAIALRIDANSRTALHSDGRLTNDGKLDKILQKWQYIHVCMYVYTRMCVCM